MDLELCYTSAVDLVRLIRARKVSPVEVVKTALGRLDQVEPLLNAFTARRDEQALAEARAAEAAVMAGRALGPLHGVPISVKDLIEVAGLRCAYGSLTMIDHVPAADAPSVERLRRAGAIVIGKTATSEFGYRGYTASPVHGVTRNAWDPGRTPGGSSGGAATSVAAGVTPVALGTDGGGSIRVPCSLTNLVGIKPQFGRVPIYPPSATPTVAHVGPLARNVADAALLLTVMSGADGRDHTSLLPPLPALGTGRRVDLGTLRVAFSPTFGYARVDPAVATVVETAVRALTGLAKVEMVKSVCEDAGEILATEFMAGCSGRLADDVDRVPDKIDPGLLAAVQAFRRQSLADYLRVVRRRFVVRDELREFFSRYDVLLSPASPVAAWPIGATAPPGLEDATVWAFFTFPFNLSGQPACTVPCGFTEGGLPVGLQIVVRPLGEEMLVAVARAVEEALSCWKLRPPLASTGRRSDVSPSERGDGGH